MRRGGSRPLVLVGVVAAAAWLGSSAFGGEEEPPPPPPTTTAAPVLKPLRIVFPEGFTRRQMAERVGAVRRSRSRAVTCGRG